MVLSHTPLTPNREKLFWTLSFLSLSTPSYFLSLFLSLSLLFSLSLNPFLPSHFSAVSCLFYFSLLTSYCMYSSRFFFFFRSIIPTAFLIEKFSSSPTLCFFKVSSPYNNKRKKIHNKTTKMLSKSPQLLSGQESQQSNPRKKKNMKTLMRPFSQS